MTSRPSPDRLRDELADVGRRVVRAGLVVGSGGNVSARLPTADEFWVTGAGTWLDQLDPAVSFARVRVSDAAVLPGRWPAPSTELALHVAMYRARPDVNAVLHLHPQAVVLLDSLGERIRLITTDHVAYVGRVVATPFLPPGTAELAEAAAAAAADGTDCVILAHHGCCVLGADVPAAHRRAANLDEAARLTLSALALTGGLAGREVIECPAQYRHA